MIQTDLMSGMGNRDRNASCDLRKEGLAAFAVYARTAFPAGFVRS